MAIRSYNEFIDNMQDRRIKKEFEQIQQEHKKNAADIAHRVQELGGRPEESTGMAGVMAATKMEVAEMAGQSDLDILKRAFDGEDIGLDSAAKIVQGNLDQESEKLIRRILSAEHEHLKTLERLVSNYEK